MWSRLYLKIQNPWWQDAKNIVRDPHLLAIEGKPYRFTPSVIEALELKEGDISTLRRPRQVGKTTTLKLLIRRLLEQETDPASILYLSCESIESFLELKNELVNFLEPRKNTRSFVFLDEVSFVPSWQRAILALANAGLHLSSSLILTGSNARDLKESSERLPGRRGKGRDLRLYPLSIMELSQLECYKKHSFQELLDLYMRIGGFPRAIAEYVTLGTITDDTYEIYRNWIVGDASRYQLRQETLKQILHRIAETLTSQITWPKLIENSPVRSHETALEYVEHLQDAFLCHILVIPAQEARRGPGLYEIKLSRSPSFKALNSEVDVLAPENFTGPLTR